MFQIFHIFQDPTTLTFTIIILFFWAFSMSYYYVFIYRPMSTSIEKYRSIIDSYNDKHIFYENYNSVNELFEANKMLKDHWIEFNKSNIRNDEQKLIYNTISPLYFFNIENLLANRWLSFWQALPGYFVSVGLFGTFLGLTDAISSIGVQIADPASSFETLHDGINGILRIAGLKFLTSIFGLAASLVFSLRFKYLNGKISDSCVKFSSKLNQLLETVTPESVAVQQLIEVKKQNELILNLNNNSQEIFRKVLVEILNQVSAHIHAEIDGQIKALDQASENFATKLNNLAQNLSEQHLDSIASMQKTIDELYSHMQQELDTIRQYNNEMLTNLAEHTETITSNLNITHNNWLNEFKTNWQTLQTELFNGLKTSSATMTSELESALTYVQKALEGLVEDLSNKTKAENELLLNNLKQCRDMVQAETRAALESYMGVMASTQEAQSESLRNWTQGFQKQIDNAATLWQNNIDTFSKDNLASIQTIFDRFEQCLAIISQHFEQAGQSFPQLVQERNQYLAKLLQDFDRDVITKLGEKLDQGTLALESQGKTQLSGMNRELKNFVSKLKEESQNAALTMSNIYTETISSTKDALINSSDVLKDTLEKLQRHSERQESHLTAIYTQLESGATQTSKMMTTTWQDYLDKNKEILIKTSEDLKTALEKASAGFGNLDVVQSRFVANLDYIVQSFDRTAEMIKSDENEMNSALTEINRIAKYFETVTLNLRNLVDNLKNNS